MRRVPYVNIIFSISSYVINSLKLYIYVLGRYLEKIKTYMIKLL